MKVENKSINDVLSKNRSSFFIPPFQRAYAWGQQEIERYYRDLKRIMDSERDENEKDKREHFFGVLVLKPEIDGFASREIVVDGQQRLTTTLLLLIALRDSVIDESIKRQIEDMFLKNQASTFSDKIKLKQVTRDWDAYRALINASEHLPSKVTDGYRQFLTKIECSDYATEEYVKALSRVNVACIFLDERPYKGEDPQIIFETLNSLGKPLSFADLIRNYVMLGMPSNDQTEIYDSVWFPLVENVLQERTSHFFRDYMQYKENKYFKVVSDNNTKELYLLFTQFVEKQFRHDKKAFVNDICRYVALYRWIDIIEAHANIACDSSKNRIIVELLRNIFHDIKADAFKPLVLGILDYHQYGFDNIKLPDDQLIEALRVIRTYLIRRRTMKLTQGENKEIAGLCNEIKTRGTYLLLDSKTEMLRLLSKGIYRLRLPNDAEIASELKRIDFYNGLNKYSKFILGKIEEHLSKISIDFRDKRITIEHVMPQKADQNKEWKKELGVKWNDIHKSYLHNIGNLILTEFNSEMGNKSLSDKKEMLKKSNLQYRNDILNRETWIIDDILAHQNEMISRFLHTFPLPVNMQQAENWDANKATSIQDLISPLVDGVEETVTGRKPISVTIQDEIFVSTTWQDVYLSVLRWLSTNKPTAFSRFINLREDNTRYPLVATRPELITLVEEDSTITSKFKRLSDGTIFSKVQSSSGDDSIYVHINKSAQDLILRMRQSLEMADMDEESVYIELKI